MGDIYGAPATPDDFTIAQEEQHKKDPYANLSPEEKTKLQAQMCSNEHIYEHHCHGKYEGVRYYSLHEKPVVCPTCGGILGENGCDLKQT